MARHFVNVVLLCVCVCVCCIRAKFMKQLVQLVEQRNAIMASGSQSQPQERKAKLDALTLPGTEENLPGVHLEDLG